MAMMLIAMSVVVPTTLLAAASDGLLIEPIYHPNRLIAAIGLSFSINLSL
jgi:hypothetical protein